LKNRLKERPVPELPEVEITRRQIEPLLVGRTIERVETTGESAFFLGECTRLRRRLRGRAAAALRRRGKYLVAELDDGCSLVIHLGMTGQLFASGVSSPRLLSATARSALGPEELADFRPDRHTHLRLRFRDGGPELYLRDVRKFGRVFLLGPGETHPRLSRLGPDALSVDGEALFAARRGRAVPVKVLLLDQKVLAGVGNIYADEALFLAGVRPGRRAARLTRSECDAIARALRRVLQRSIDTGGSSISDYLAPDGADGAYQDERRVYARAGCPCYSCSTEIRRTVIAQRGTHYCPRCQR
jgi:formamidopyrimidine-DNA glycosylase